MDILNKASEFFERKNDEKEMRRLWNLLGRVGVGSEVKVDVNSVVTALAPLIRKYPDYIPPPSKQETNS